MASRFIMPTADVGKGITPSDGAKLSFFETGTSTPKDTFTTQAATIANANPVIADSNGVFPDIFITGTYKVTLTDKNDVQSGFGEADPVDEFANVAGNDERYGPIFATVAAMIASSPLSVDGLAVTLIAGMTVHLQGYFTAGDGGSKTGLIAASQSVDEFGDHTNANGTVFLMDEDSPLLEQYGCAGDWNGTTGTDDSLAMAAAIDSDKPLRAGSGRFRITQRIDSLTTERLRLVGVSSCYKDSQEDEDGLTQIICDGAEFFGGYDFANQRLEPAKQRIADLRNVAFIAANSVSTAIVTTMNGGAIKDCHFKDFDNHGMIDCGGVQCILGPNSFDDCGLTQAASGAVASDTFIDGCAMLSVSSIPTPFTNNNFDASRARDSARFGSSKTIDINTFNTVAATTSFKALIMSNTRSVIVIVRAHQGVWIGNSTADMPSPHLEVFASGGVVAGDGEPYSLAYYNSTVNLTNEFFVTTPANAKGVLLQLRDDPFNAANDLEANNRQKSNEQIFSRAHLESIKLGGYLPSTDSTEFDFDADLGSTKNPLLKWDAATRCMVGSEGLAYYPAQISMPIVESSTVAGSGGTFDFTSATIIPDDNLNGTGGRGVYEIDVEIVDTNTAEVFYHGAWRGIRQANGNNFEVRFYELGHVDNNPPAGGFTVTENGSGPFTLRVTNNTAFGFRCTAKSRRTGLTQTFTF